MRKDAAECAEMRSTLLTLHLLAVVVWLGASLYDLFLLREIRRAAGGGVELALIRIPGVLMSYLVGWDGDTARLCDEGFSNTS